MRAIERPTIAALAGALLCCAGPRPLFPQEVPGPQMMQAQMERIVRERPRDAELAARAFLRRIAPRVFPAAAEPGYYLRSDTPDPAAEGVRNQLSNEFFGLTRDQIQSVEVVKGNPALMYEGQPDPGVIVVTIRQGRIVLQPPSNTGWYLDVLRVVSPESYWPEVAQLTVQSQMTREVGQRDTTRARFMEGMFAIEFDARIAQRGYHDAEPQAQTKIRSSLEQLMSRHFDLETRLMELELADAARRLDAVRAELAKRPGNRAERVQRTVDDILRVPQGPQVNVKLF